MTASRTMWPTLIREKMVKALPRLASRHAAGRCVHADTSHHQRADGDWRCSASGRELTEVGLCEHQ
eukprot:3618530-Prymnesium_polylepis.1